MPEQEAHRLCGKANVDGTSEARLDSQHAAGSGGPSWYPPRHLPGPRTAPGEVQTTTVPKTEHRSSLIAAGDEGTVGKYFPAQKITVHAKCVP